MRPDLVARWKLDLLNRCNFDAAFAGVNALPIDHWLANSLRGYAASLGGRSAEATDLFRRSRAELSALEIPDRRRAATALFLMREHHLLREEYLDDEQCDDLAIIFLREMTSSMRARLIACHLACDGFRHLAMGRVEASMLCLQSIIVSLVKSDELKAFVHSCLSIAHANGSADDRAIREAENSGMWVQASQYPMAHIVGGYRLAAIYEYIGHEARAQEWAAFADRVEVHAPGKRALRERVEKRLAQSIAHSYLFV